MDLTINRQTDLELFAEIRINMERDNGFYTRAEELQLYYNEIRSEMNYELSEDAVTLLGPANLRRSDKDDTLVGKLYLHLLSVKFAHPQTGYCTSTRIIMFENATW